MASPRIPERNPEPEKGLQARLAELVTKIRKQFGWTNTDEPVQVVADGVGIPEVHAQEPLRQKIQEFLNRDPELVADINAQARDTLGSDPLRWMPGNSPTVRWTIASKI